MSKDLGTLEAGKIADIVLLGGNPLGGTPQNGFWDFLNVQVTIKGGQVLVDKRWDANLWVRSPTCVSPCGSEQKGRVPALATANSRSTLRRHTRLTPRMLIREVNRLRTDPQEPSECLFRIAQTLTTGFR
jgi:hypothetical protein